MSTGRRTARGAAAVIVAVGCALLLAGLGVVPIPPGGQERRLAAAEATWVAAGEPEVGAASGPAAGPSHAGGSDAGPSDGGPSDGGLRAGDTSGGAVTYLKFVVPAERLVAGAWLELTSIGRDLPELVELVVVPDTSWQAETLRWEAAPVLGPVVQSVRPDPAEERLVFDVSALVRSGPGAYAFAVTVPPDQGYAVFAGPDAGPDAPVLRLRERDRYQPVPVVTGHPVVPEDATAPRIPIPPGALPASGPLTPGAGPSPGASPSPGPEPAPQCVLRELLVPSCGVLWGVAPNGHTGSPRAQALADFEDATGRRQDIYHAYHRAEALFPTAEEAAIAADGRILFLNWKPLNWSWARIAGGAADPYLDRLADHIDETFPDPFFFTIHHEPENDVRPRAGSGFEPTDYAAMFRHVVERLRGSGVDNLVTVVDYMAYVPWNAKPWFPELYPGDDVVDWIGWNSYAYSDPGYGYGDFAEMMNRRSAQYPDWPGFYTWATRLFPDKPFMVGEWGVWYSRANPGHMARFYESVARQTPLFPRIKAMVYFDTPGDQRARDSRPTVTEAGLAEFQRLGTRPYFQVRLN